MMASEIGPALRGARESRGLDVAEAQRATKIRSKYLQAMEDERWEVLPGKAAVHGFLRTYAQYLGLDPEPLLKAYDRGPGATEHAGRVPADMLPQPGDLKGRARWPGAVVVVAFIAIAIAGVLVLAIESGSDGDGEETSPASEVAGSDGGSGGGGSPSGEPETETETTTTTSEEESGSGGEPDQEARPSKRRVELKSTGEVWVCLLSNRGRALVDGETLAAGESRGPFERRAFEAAFGNGSVRVRVDGKRIGVPASADPIGYAITPRRIKQLDEAERPDCL